MEERASNDGPVLIAYRLRAAPVMPLVTAGASRDWMDNARERFIHRCLPLVMANQAGWFILNSHDFTVTWDGRPTKEALALDYGAGAEPYPASSHFGYGVLTWHLPYLFRTSAGYNLLVRGPANWPKAGACALEGLVEADWAVASFTMNWKLTMPGKLVKFAAGEPICMLVPQRRGELERVAPQVREIDEEAELARAFREWHDRRLEFNEQLEVSGSDARRIGWQKHYFRGETPDGARAGEHQTKLALSPFVEGD